MVSVQYRNIISSAIFVERIFDGSMKKIFIEASNVNYIMLFKQVSGNNKRLLNPYSKCAKLVLKRFDKDFETKVSACARISPHFFSREEEKISCPTCPSKLSASPLT